MPASQLGKAMGQLHTTLLLQEASDGQLLDCFIRRHEEAALEVLVRRHAHMVWGTCRRILSNHHDAEDAFQATFLVLVRKAASIAPKEMVGNWLYGVAHQTALKARATAAKRKKRECQVTTMPEASVTEQEIWCDLQPLLDQELSKLPDKYRTVILLCDLEGKTRNEAARQIGCPEGTVATWLARGRVLLAKRLARHGLVMSGGSLAAVLAQNASAGVPASVVSSTINAVTLCTAGQGAMISVEVIALTEGMLRAMFLTKLKTVMTVLLVLGMVSFGGGMLTHYTVAAQSGQPEKPPIESEKGEGAGKPSAKAEEKPQEGDIQKPLDPKLLAKLAAQLRSKDWEERSAAVLALTKLLAAKREGETDFGPVIEPLFENAGWGGEARKNARMAEDALVRIGGQAKPLLRQRLISTDAHDRRVAAELLVRIGPPDAALVALLRPLLTDSDDYVRKAAIDGLGISGSPAKAAVDDLERVATNDPILARRVGARIALIRVAGASETRVRALAAFLELKDELKGEQNQSRKEAAVYAASALGELGPKARAAEPQLLAALKHTDSQVRINAAHTLGQIGANSPEAVTLLIDLLKNDAEREARRSAAGSLGAFGPAAKAAIPALRAALKEDGKGGWWVAADTLGKIGGAEVVPILIEALVNPDDDIRLTSMRGLGNLGVVARPALMALEKARQEDPREHNRAAAAEALRKIERAVPKMK